MVELFANSQPLTGKRNPGIKQLIEYLRTELTTWESFSKRTLVETRTEKGVEWALANRVFAAIIGKTIYLRLPDPITKEVEEWPVASRVTSANHRFDGWISISLGEDPRRYLRGLLRTAFEFTLTEIDAAE